MRERVQQLYARIDALSLRERLLVLFAVVLLMFTLWNQLLMAPLGRSQEQLKAQIGQARNDITRLERQTDEISRAREIDPDQENLTRRQQLQTEIADLDQRLKEQTDALIAPDVMAKLLEQILTRDTDLRLVRIENLKSMPLLDPGADKQEAPAGAAPGIYRHGIVIEFDGGYLSTLRYLRALEALPWRFYWDGVEYKVDHFPNAHVTITVHTLGLREGWIGV
jgi:MSHA biogenesis protein MshJ